MIYKMQYFAQTAQVKCMDVTLQLPQTYALDQKH